jgi:hypothetical protein
MARYEVAVFAEGSAFWCVDREREIREWIDGEATARFAAAPELRPSVKTTSLDVSMTALELRWTGLEGRSAWHAASRAIELIEGEFPHIAAVGFLRIDATQQEDTDHRAGRWTKPSRVRR